MTENEPGERRADVACGALGVRGEVGNALEGVEKVSEGDHGRSRSTKTDERDKTVAIISNDKYTKKNDLSNYTRDVIDYKQIEVFSLTFAQP